MSVAPITRGGRIVAAQPKPPRRGRSSHAERFANAQHPAGFTSFVSTQRGHR